MVIPFLSTFTLFTELLITSIVLYIFYSGYKYNKFPFKLALFALVYEVSFNINYRVFRAVTHQDETPHSAFRIGLAIFHSSFSLIMFILLIVFLILAWINYKKGINFFKKYKALSFLFIILWLVAVFSGILFYFVAYF